MSDINKVAENLVPKIKQLIISEVQGSMADAPMVEIIGLLIGCPIEAAAHIWNEFMDDNSADGFMEHVKVFVDDNRDQFGKRSEEA